MELQYITVTLIEDHDTDHKPPFLIDTTTIAPIFVLQIGRISIHMTPERLAQLGRAIDAVTMFSASTVAETPNSEESNG